MVAIINLLSEGNISKKTCEKYGINPWHVKMVAESFITAPHATKERGFRMLINDFELMIKKVSSPNEMVRDVRHLGNLDIAEIEFFEVNPYSTFFMVKYLTEKSIKIRKNGVMFKSHDLLFIIKPASEKHKLITKQDRNK
jgi:hypothetical protein